MKRTEQAGDWVLEAIQKLLTKKEKKVIHDLASKPKVRKRAYKVWRCADCSEEFYFEPLRCPLCTGK